MSNENSFSLNTWRPLQCSYISVLSQRITGSAVEREKRRASGWSGRSDRTLLHHHHHHQPSPHWGRAVSSWGEGGRHQASDDFLSLYFTVALVSFFHLMSRISMILLRLVLTLSPCNDIWESLVWMKPKVISRFLILIKTQRAEEKTLSTLKVKRPCSLKYPKIS